MHYAVPTGEGHNVTLLHFLFIAISSAVGIISQKCKGLNVFIYRYELVTATFIYIALFNLKYVISIQTLKGIQSPSLLCIWQCSYKFPKPKNVLVFLSAKNVQTL